MAMIFLGLVLAYNPIYSYYLMSHGALGGMSIRAVTGGLFLILAVSYAASRFLFKANFRIEKTNFLILMTLFLGFYLAGLLVGLLNDNSLIYFGLDAFPLLEMLCIYYIIRLSPGIKIDPGGIVKLLSGYIVLMCVCDVAIYWYLSFVLKISFGALRASINGVIVNRLMDFVVPLLGPGLVVMSRETKNKIVRRVLPFCVILTVGLTFYRTAYVAFFAVIIFLAARKRTNAVILGKTALAASLFGIFAFMLLQHGGSAGASSDMAQLVKERIWSTFDSREKDFAINSRFEQTFRMFGELPNVPLVGYGMGGFIDKDAIQVTSNYFLQVFLLLGIPGGILFVWLYFRVLLTSLRLSRTSEDHVMRQFFAAMGSVVAGLGVVLLFFPYTIYFPLLYIFGAIAGITDVCQLRRRGRSLLDPKGADERK